MISWRGVSRTRESEQIPRRMNIPGKCEKQEEVMSERVSKTKQGPRVRG